MMSNLKVKTSNHSKLLQKKFHLTVQTLSLEYSSASLQCILRRHDFACMHIVFNQIYWSALATAPAETSAEAIYFVFIQVQGNTITTVFLASGSARALVLKERRVFSLILHFFNYIHPSFQNNSVYFCSFDLFFNFTKDHTIINSFEGYQV